MPGSKRGLTESPWSTVPLLPYFKKYSMALITIKKTPFKQNQKTMKIKLDTVYRRGLNTTTQAEIIKGV